MRFVYFVTISVMMLTLLGLAAFLAAGHPRWPAVVVFGTVIGLVLLESGGGVLILVCVGGGGHRGATTDEPMTRVQVHSYAMMPHHTGGRDGVTPIWNRAGRMVPRGRDPLTRAPKRPPGFRQS